MDEKLLADEFDHHRTHLHAVAQRMLGNTGEADDAVQEAWLRLTRSDPAQIDNLGGWLTTVVARISLDLLRSRTARRETALPDTDHAAVPAESGPVDPEHEAMLADSVGLALLVVLDTLSPAERLAFVLHDMFAVPFDEIAPVLERTPEATRQLASRARRRVRGSSAAPDRSRQREVVRAFLAASREGDFEGLLSMLDPEVVLRADATVVSFGGAEPEVRGPRAVAETFSGRARAARPALVDGMPGLAWQQGGVTRVVFDFLFDGDTIVGIDLLADPDLLAELEVSLLDVEG
jgi:RNA polymerase sigma-70 factor (ECF subfamily)